MGDLVAGAAVIGDVVGKGVGLVVGGPVGEPVTGAAVTGDSVGDEVGLVVGEELGVNVIPQSVMWNSLFSALSITMVARVAAVESAGKVISKLKSVQLPSALVASHQVQDCTPSMLNLSFGDRSEVPSVAT
jgi:hypothetical protein